MEQGWEPTLFILISLYSKGQLNNQKYYYCYYSVVTKHHDNSFKGLLQPYLHKYSPMCRLQSLTKKVLLTRPQGKLTFQKLQAISDLMEKMVTVILHFYNSKTLSKAVKLQTHFFSLNKRWLVFFDCRFTKKAC